MALTAGRAVWLRALAAVAGVVAVLLVYGGVLDPLGKAAVGDAGPSWLPDEAGILLMAAAALVVAAVMLRRGRPGEAAA